MRALLHSERLLATLLAPALGLGAGRPQDVGYYTRTGWLWAALIAVALLLLIDGLGRRPTSRHL